MIHNLFELRENCFKNWMAKCNKKKHERNLNQIKKNVIAEPQCFDVKFLSRFHEKHTQKIQTVVVRENFR